MVQVEFFPHKLKKNAVMFILTAYIQWLIRKISRMSEYKEIADDMVVYIDNPKYVHKCAKSNKWVYQVLRILSQYAKIYYIFID